MRWRRQPGEGDCRRIGRLATHMTLPEPLQLRFEAQDTAVRGVMQSVRAYLHPSRWGADSLQKVEIALTEALNNIVEHGFSPDQRGEISLHVSWQAGRLRCFMADQGAPYPENNPPVAVAQDLNRPVADLPEGGFGWFLIFELADEVAYQRVEGENRLTLWFDLPSPRSEGT